MGHAAALARAAVMARTAASERASEVRRARRHGNATEFRFEAIAEERFLAGEWHGRLELTVRKMIQTFFRTADADVFFDKIVIRFNILVAERPVFAETVVRSGFEVKFAEAERDAAPDVGAATRHAHATHPVIRLIFWRGVGLLEIVGEPVGGVFVANVENGLDGACFADKFRRHVPVFERKGRLVFGEVSVGLRAARLEKSDFEARLREALAGPASGCAGADHDDVKLCVCHFGCENLSCEMQRGNGNIPRGRI